MEMSEFAARASETDSTAGPDRGLPIVLHAIAAEDGQRRNRPRAVKGLQQLLPARARRPPRRAPRR